MVNSFSLDRFLFFDIFHKNNKLFLICPVYNLDGLNLKELHIYANGVELTLFEKYSELKYVEPIEILIYNFTSDKIVNLINVNYNIIKKEYKLSHITTTLNNRLCLATLFKDDYKLINIFYNYYIKQGVTDFYMYYNGPISDDIREKYSLPGITLIEWDFQFWSIHGIVRPDFYSHHHHAQIGQIHHAIYRYGKDNHKYIILCDLDEYIFIPGIPLLTCLEQNPHIDMFGFRNRWSDTHDGKIPNIFPNSIKCDNNLLPFGERSKCIYKTNIINIVGVHNSKQLVYSPYVSLNNTLLHFYKWTQPNRINNTDTTITLDITQLP